MGISILPAGITAVTAARQASAGGTGDFESFLSTAGNGVSSGSGASGTGANPAASGSGSAGGGSYSNDPAVQAFMKYMNESTAQKFEDAWLASHGLTEAKLKAMTPEQRAGVIKQMEQDMKQRIEHKMQSNLSGTLVPFS